MWIRTGQLAPALTIVANNFSNSPSHGPPEKSGRGRARTCEPHGCEPRFTSSTVPRLEGNWRSTLLPILAKRLIVNQLGEIVGYELNKPFAYLHRIARGNTPIDIGSKGSDQVRLGASPKRAPSKRRSSPIDSTSPPSKEFESPLVQPPITDVTAFLAGLRFEHRDKLADLPLHLAKGELPRVFSDWKSTFGIRSISDRFSASLKSSVNSWTKTHRQCARRFSWLMNARLMTRPFQVLSPFLLWQTIQTHKRGWRRSGKP